MEKVDAYRAQILDCLRKAQDKDGQPLLTEKQALALSQEFSDGELLDGMDFNTPDEVAEMLLEAGL